MKTLHIGVVVVLLLSVLSFAGAQNRPVLTFEGAITTALERNLSVQQSLSTLNAAKSGVLSAYGTYLPRISGSMGWTRSEAVGRSSTQIVGGIPIPVSGDYISSNWSAGMDASLTLFDGLNREGNVGRASASANSAEETYLRTRQQIVYTVQSSYLSVLRYEQLVGVSRQNLERDRRQLERISEQSRVGSASIGDVYRQQAQVATDEYNYISAQNTYDKSVADLLSLIGLEVNDQYVIADSAVAQKIEQLDDSAHVFMVPEFSVVREQAMSYRSDYKSARENLRGADNGVMSAWSGYLPQLTAFGRFSTSNSEIPMSDAVRILGQPRNYSWGISLGWTLFDGFATNSRIQSARATQRSAELTLQQTERNINVDVKKALLDLEASRRAYEASVKALISATQDYRVAQEKYNLGSGTLVDLQVANAGLVTAQANKINAAYGFTTAQLNLEFAVGMRSY